MKRDVDDKLAQRFVALDVFDGCNRRCRAYGNEEIPACHVVFYQAFEVAFRNAVDEAEADAGDKHENRHHDFYVIGVEVGDTAVAGGESTGGDCRHSMTYCLKQVHRPCP